MKHIYVWTTIQCCCSYDLLCNHVNYFSLCEYNIDTPIRLKIHTGKKTQTFRLVIILCNVLVRKDATAGSCLPPPLMQDGNRDASRLKEITKLPGFSFFRNFTVKLFHIQTGDSYLCIFTDILNQNACLSIHEKGALIRYFVNAFILILYYNHIFHFKKLK